MPGCRWLPRRADGQLPALLGGIAVAATGHPVHDERHESDRHDDPESDEERRTDFRVRRSRGRSRGALPPRRPGDRRTVGPVAPRCGGTGFRIGSLRRRWRSRGNAGSRLLRDGRPEVGDQTGHLVGGPSNTVGRVGDRMAAQFVERDHRPLCNRCPAVVVGELGVPGRGGSRVDGCEGVPNGHGRHEGVLVTVDRVSVVLEPSQDALDRCRRRLPVRPPAWRGWTRDRHGALCRRPWTCAFGRSRNSEGDTTG